MGIDRQIDVAVKSLKFQPDDRFVLLARSTIPQGLFSVDVNQSSEEILKTMFEVAVASESKVPFWISVLG